MDVSDDISNNSLSPVNGAAAGAPRTVGRPTALQDEGTGDQGRSDASGHVPPAVGAPPGWHSCLRMIYVKHDPRVLSPRPHWPIPEGFWQDSTMTTLVSALSSAPTSTVILSYGMYLWSCNCILYLGAWMLCTLLVFRCSHSSLLSLLFSSLCGVLIQ